MSTRASVCFLAFCLILIVQVSSAYEVKPCDGFNGKLLSLEVHNCPNKTAEYCEIKMSDGIHWDVKYTAGVSYETAWTGFLSDEFLGEATNHCRAQPGFCPGKAGQKKAYHYDFELSIVVPQTGVVRPLKLITNPVFDPEKKFDENTIVCAEFLAKFIDA